jgi:hypothetical protein
LKFGTGNENHPFFAIKTLFWRVTIHMKKHTPCLLVILMLGNIPAFNPCVFAAEDSLKSLIDLRQSLCTTARTACYKPLPIETKGHIELFLMIGSSNLIGRAMPRRDDSIPDPRVISIDLKYGGWKNTIEPAMPNSAATTGQGCALAFGKRYATLHPDRYFGLLCCGQNGAGLNAYAGSRFGLTSAWGPIFGLDNQGAPHGVNLIEFATSQGYHTWGGVIIETLPLGIEPNMFEAKLKQIIDSVRVWLNAPDLPVLIPEPAPFESAYLGTQAADAWMQAVRGLPGRVPNTGFIRTDDCRSLLESQELDVDGVAGDANHFSYASNVVIGQRFAEAFTALKANRAGVRGTVTPRTGTSRRTQLILFSGTVPHSLIVDNHTRHYDLRGRLSPKPLTRSGVYFIQCE